MPRCKQQLEEGRSSSLPLSSSLSSFSSDTLPQQHLVPPGLLGRTALTEVAADPSPCADPPRRVGGVQVPFFVVVTRLEADKEEMAAERERWKAALLERQGDVARIEQQMQVSRHSAATALRSSPCPPPATAARPVRGVLSWLSSRRRTSLVG